MKFSRGESRLSGLIDKADMTQAELSRRCGYTPQMISKFVNGKKMSPEAMYTIAHALGCTMEELYHWIEKKGL